jgi:hypothetical protein
MASDILILSPLPSQDINLANEGSVISFPVFDFLVSSFACVKSRILKEADMLFKKKSTINSSRIIICSSELFKIHCFPKATSATDKCLN